MVMACQKVEEANAHLHHDKMVKNPSITLIETALLQPKKPKKKLLLGSSRSKRKSHPDQFRPQTPVRSMLTERKHSANNEQHLSPVNDQLAAAGGCVKALAVRQSEDTELKILEYHRAEKEILGIKYSREIHGNFSLQGTTQYFGINALSERTGANLDEQ